MTVPSTPDQVVAAPPTVLIEATSTTLGCTGCGSQATVVLDPHRGRLCPDHATLPEGPYRPDLATDMVELGRVDAAFTYLGIYLARAIDARFQLAQAALGVGRAA